MFKRNPLFVLAVVVPLFLAGCQTTGTNAALSAGESQVQLRQIQTRAFDTTKEEKTLRTVITTLQDLGFVIDKADKELGTISGTKLNGYHLKMTVSVRPRNKKQLLVRASAQYNIHPVEDPEPYQQFFAALSKAMFLEAHQVE